MWICAKCQAVNVSREPRCRICGALPGAEDDGQPSGISFTTEEVPLDTVAGPTEKPTETNTPHAEKTPSNITAPEPPSYNRVPDPVPESPEIPEPIPVLVDIPDSLIPGSALDRKEEQKEERRPSLTARIPGTPPGNRVGPIRTSQAAVKTPVPPIVNTPKANQVRQTIPANDSYNRTAPVYPAQRPDVYHATEPVSGGFSGNNPIVNGHDGKKKKAGVIAGIVALIAVLVIAAAAVLLRVSHNEIVLENVPCTIEESVRFGKVIRTDFYDEDGNQATEVTVSGSTVTAVVPNGSGSTEYTAVDGAVTEVRVLDRDGKATGVTSYQGGKRVETELNADGESIHAETYDSYGALISEQNLLEDGTVQHLNYQNGLVVSETVTDQNGQRLYELTYTYNGDTLVRKERYENDQLVLEEEYSETGVIENAVYYENGQVTLTEQYDEDGDLEHSEERIYDAGGNCVKKITYDAWVSCYSTGDYYYSGSWGVPVYKPFTEVRNCTSFMLAFKYTMVNSSWLGKHIVFARVNNSWTTVGEIYINDLDTWYTIEYETKTPSKIDGIALRPAAASKDAYSLSYVFGDVVCETDY